MVKKRQIGTGRPLRWQTRASPKGEAVWCVDETKGVIEF
jgi:hypothetical protein